MSRTGSARCGLSIVIGPTSCAHRSRRRPLTTTEPASEFSLVEYLARRGLTKHDLLAFVEPMRVARKVRQQPSPDTLLAMLARANEPRDRALLAVAANTGLRASEIARLRVGDLDLDTLTLRVWVSKSSMEDDMPVTADLAAEMRRWLLAYAKSIQRPLIPVDYCFRPAPDPGTSGATVRTG